MRDEAHRFGITHHRKKRSKVQVSSELDNIKGIGEKTALKLLSEYKTLENIIANANDKNNDGNPQHY